MTKQLVEVITSVERRPRWSREEKERLVAATLEPNASVSEIARSAGIHGERPASALLLEAEVFS
ncbi:transposase [Sinorhizobium meliloti]|uniref:transposase n=1 Tax=Rhizobium meliloti TaxID=382 RepID=UPI0012948D9D|nr:transposase [Sinorhizobium meliloti]MQX93798.1 transposase [Sinorhizobium meliloti]